MGARPVDIAFDHAAAAAAVTTLIRAAGLLAEVSARRSTAAHRAGLGFRGVFAADFATADSVVGATTLDVFQVLRDLQAQIEAAADAAHTAQSVRSREQRAWDDARAATPAGVV